MEPYERGDMYLLIFLRSFILFDSILSYLSEKDLQFMIPGYLVLKFCM